MHRNKSVLLIAALSSMAAMLLPGCSLLPKASYSEPQYYDIGIPEKVADLPFDVEVRPFTSEASGRFKMLYRIHESEVNVDEYSRWTQPPGSLVTKYLRMAFSSGKIENQDMRFTISGTVFAFEANLEKKQAHMLIRYAIALDDNDQLEKPFSILKDFTAPMKDDTPQALAEAMNDCAEALVENIRQNLMKVRQIVLKHMQEQEQMKAERKVRAEQDSKAIPANAPQSPAAAGAEKATAKQK